jgi:hypothetical protein
MVFRIIHPQDRALVAAPGLAGEEQAAAVIHDRGLQHSAPAA